MVSTLSLPSYMLGLMSRIPLLSMSELGSIGTYKCITIRLNVLSFVCVCVCVCVWKFGKLSPDMYCLGGQFPYLRLVSDLIPT